MGTTIQRPIDELGRLTLAIEHRHVLNWLEKDSIDMILQEDRDCIVLRKSIPSCSICGITGVSLLQLGKDRKHKEICENCKNFIGNCDMNTNYY